MAKTVLITGGARGIGRAIAVRLLDDGWSVAFTYAQSLEPALAFEREATASIRRDDQRIDALECDVCDPAAVASTVEIVAERFGRIDALVNNAGIRRDVLLYNMSDGDWDEVIDTDLRGAWSMTKAVLPLMMKARRGSIVNVASLSGLHGVAGQTNYSAAKGGLIAFSRSLAREVARSGIRVNCVAPGLVDTDMIAGLDPEVRKEMLREIPMRRLVKADEVAAAVAFLLSDDASAVTGQVLCVDGGVSA